MATADRAGTSERFASGRTDEHDLADIHERAVPGPVFGAGGGLRPALRLPPIA
jgi:hypothetical protein